MCSESRRDEESQLRLATLPISGRDSSLATLVRNDTLSNLRVLCDCPCPRSGGPLALRLNLLLCSYGRAAAEGIDAAFDEDGGDQRCRYGNARCLISDHTHHRERDIG